MHYTGMLQSPSLERARDYHLALKLEKNHVGHVVRVAEFMNFETPVILCPQQKGFRCSQLLVLSSSSAVRSSLQSRSGGDLLSAGHAGGLAAGSCLFMMVILLLTVAVLILRLRMQSDRAGLPRHAQAERTLPDVPRTSR